jgi:hypothetical protein
LFPTWHWLQLVIAPAGDIWWLPVNVQPVELWFHEVVVKGEAVVWQFEQFNVAKVVPAEGCTGSFVFCQSVWWHAELPQSVGTICRL